ncbi:MAG: hypothetical protein ABI791_13835 [Acidobacteriota bacterium]
MGKLILGIVVVIALQITFSIYLAMDTVVDELAVSSSDPHAQDRDLSLYAEVNPDHSDITALGSPVGIPASADAPLPAVRVRAKVSQSRFENRQKQRFSRRGYPHLSNNSYVVHDQIASVVRREYFGSMIVETGFHTSNDRVTKMLKGKTRRLVFGKMVVEHKYAA